MVKIYASFYIANNRYSGNDRYSGIKSPDRFFRYSGRCLYSKLKNKTENSRQGTLKTQGKKFSFKSFGNTGFKAPPFH